MAIQTSGTNRISNNGQLQNIGSLDATTTTTIAAAAGGGAPWDGEAVSAALNFNSNSNSNAAVALAADNNKGRYIRGVANHTVFNSNPNNVNIGFNGTGAWITPISSHMTNNNGGGVVFGRYQKGNTGVNANVGVYRVTNTGADHGMVFQGYLPAGGNMTINRSSVQFDVWDE